MNDLMPPAERDMPAGHHELRKAHLMSELSSPAKRSRRFMFGGLAAVGLAGALTAAVVLAPTAGVGDRRPPAAANAQEVLNRAAETAEDQPDLKPRPDQFIYIETREKTEPRKGRPAGTNHVRDWKSVDGKRVNLSVQSHLPPHKMEYNGPPAVMRMPTDTATMAEWLKGEKTEFPRSITVGLCTDRGTHCWNEFPTATAILRSHYVPPASTAVMFRALSKVPGITVTRNVTDAMGRRGIAVGQPWKDGSRFELIFDPVTYRWLGTRGVDKNGAVLDSLVVVKVAVTDKAGQQP